MSDCKSSIKITTLGSGGGTSNIWEIESNTIQPINPNNDLKVDSLGGIDNSVTVTDADGVFTI